MSTAAQIARYQQKAQAALAAWQAVMNQTPTVHALALAMSVAELETAMGDAWAGEHNWGWIHARPLNASEKAVLNAAGINAGHGTHITQGALAAARNALPPQPGLSLHIDTGPADPYFVWTPVFPTDEAGAERFLHVLLKPNVVPIIGNAQPIDLARAMYANGYFQGNSSDRETNIQGYGGSIAKQLAKIEPAIQNLSGPAPDVVTKSWVQKFGEGLTAVAAGALAVYTLVTFSNPKPVRRPAYARENPYARDNPAVVPAYSQLRDLRYFAHPGGQGFGNRTVSFRTAHVLYNRGWIQPGWATRADQLLTPMAIITLDGLTALNATLDRPLAVNETSIAHHPYAWYAWPVWQDNLVERTRRV